MVGARGNASVGSFVPDEKNFMEGAADTVTKPATSKRPVGSDEQLPILDTPQPKTGGHEDGGIELGKGIFG